MSPALWLATLLLLFLPASASDAFVGVERVASGLTRTVGISISPTEPDRLYIVDQTGKVWIYESGSVLPTPFLDISTKVSDVFSPGSIERGLLGLAFHPDYLINGFFYVYYMNDTDDMTVLERYTVSTNPDLADHNSGAVLLTLAQPDEDHNGGQLAFGPDNYLYVGVGDGGDRYNAQDTTNLLGTILRLDVKSPALYSIPLGNPFVGSDPLDEIWAYGLRNPWRFSFDRLTGDLYIGDVGVNLWEEIDYQPALTRGGQNYGYCVLEGSLCNALCGATGGCNDGSFVDPIWEYAHSYTDPVRCSITGGYVYRGTAIPQLKGRYFYADFCSATIWSLRVVQGTVVSASEWTSYLQPADGSIDRISAFGEDADGELYIVDWGSGVGGSEIYKIVPAEPTAGPFARRGDRLLESSPNPFNPRVRLRFELTESSEVALTVMNARGRNVRTIRGLRFDAGIHEVPWDGKDDAGRAVSTGVYHVRLETASGSDMGKVTLLR